jgi:hypothetical protein
LVLLAAQPAPEPIPSAAAEGVARRYFHALVALEELQDSLPPEDAEHPRTVERYPGLFAADEERNRRFTEFQRIEEPRASEALPALDLDARDGDFERLFGQSTREDRLVEQWRIARFAYAESKRLLDRLLADASGPLPVSPALAWG